MWPRRSLPTRPPPASCLVPSPRPPTPPTGSAGAPAGASCAPTTRPCVRWSSWPTAAPSARTTTCATGADRRRPALARGTRCLERHHRALGGRAQVLRHQHGQEAPHGHLVAPVDGLAQLEQLLGEALAVEGVLARHQD